MPAQRSGNFRPEPDEPRLLRARRSVRRASAYASAHDNSTKGWRNVRKTDDWNSRTRFHAAGRWGGSISLSKLAGKKVVLYFYPKDDTSGCTKEAIAFNGLRAAFAKAGTEIVGVSPDSAASHDKFKKKYDLDFPLAADEEKAMLDAYGVWVEKSMYGKKYMGVSVRPC